MNEFYHGGSRELQDRFDTRRLADRIEQRLVTDRIGAEDKAFIESLDMFFLATSDAAGQPSCSYKGGEPGFVDETTSRLAVYLGPIAKVVARKAAKQATNRQQFVQLVAGHLGTQERGAFLREFGFVELE